MNHARGVPPRLSRFNALRGLADLWGAAEPAEFHWRLLRYFCWTRLLVAVVLASYAWVHKPAPSVLAALAGGWQRGTQLQPALLYVGVALVMLVSVLLWRRRFQLRVRMEVIADLVLLSLLYHALELRGEGLAMIFLLPVLEAGALTSLLLALFAAAVAALSILAGPFMQSMLNSQPDGGLLSAGLYGLVFMIAAMLMHLLANRQIAQEKLALAREQELRLQQLVNRLMVNDMQDGVMLVRANGVVVAANPAAMVLLGVQPAERSAAGGGSPLSDLRQIPRLQPLLEMMRDWRRRKDDAPRVLQLLPVPAQHTGPAAGLNTRLRLRFLLPGLASLRSTFAATMSASYPVSQGLGASAWSELSPEAAARMRLAIAQAEATAWRPEDEALLRSEMRDTVLVHIESWERIAEQVQQEKLAAMGRLVASVAHQIRNPLAAISQASELLAENDRVADQIGAAIGAEPRNPESDIEARLLRIIQDNVRRLDQVVSDVLQMSRRPRTERSAVRLGQALPDIVERWRLEMRARVGLTAPPQDGLVNPNIIRLACYVTQPVVFDPSQLQQVVGNLLDNAWRYCSRLPGAIRVLAHTLDQHHAELIIWNDGAEISRETQRSLFEPFFTSEAQGTGLGLFMARELCGANDAQVRYGTIALATLMEQTGAFAAAGRDTLPSKAFVLTLRVDTADGVPG